MELREVSLTSLPHTLLPTHHTFHTAWHKVHIHTAAPELLQAVPGDHSNNVEILEQSASFWEICCALYIAVHRAGLDTGHVGTHPAMSQAQGTISKHLD